MAVVQASSRLGLAQLGLFQLGAEWNTSGPPVLIQEIDLTGVASVAAVGSITVIRGFIVSLTGIASVAAVGSLSIALSQGIQIPGIVSQAALGIPTVTGGVMATRIHIGGVDRSKYLRVQTAAVASQTMGRWSSTFDLFVGDGHWAPARGQTVLITDFGRRIFAGCLVDVEVDRVMSTVTDIIFHCQATDKASICDHRVVTTTTFVAGTDAADIFRTIAQNWLIGEGLTTDMIPSTIGAIESDQPFNYVSVTNAFDVIANLVDAAWWVDVFGQIRLELLANCPACPFSITETSKNWRNLRVKYSLLDFRNVQYVRSNLSTLPTAGTAAGLTITYTVNQAEAAARGFAQGAAVLPSPAASIISLKVNGVLQNFYYADDPVTYDITNPLYGHVWWMFQDTPYVNPPGSSTLVPSPSEKPGLGATIEIVYIPSVAQSTEVIKSVSPFAPVPMPGLTPQDGETFNTCGSGTYEAVEQVNDIVSVADLEAIAQALLARNVIAPPKITFETDCPNAAVGQKLTVNIPLSYLASQTLLITNVSGSSQAVNLLQDHPALADDGRGSTFRWRIEAGPDVANWIKWFERLIRRTEHPNPVVRRELPTFILEPGGSLSAGTVSQNPYRVKNTCKLIEAYAVAGVPPIDQDLYLDLLSANLGGRSIFKNPIKIPATATGLSKTTVFYINPAFLFKDDILTPFASYVVTGGSPVPAGSVSLDVVGEW